MLEFFSVSLNINFFLSTCVVMTIFIFQVLKTSTIGHSVLEGGHHLISTAVCETEYPIIFV